MAHSPANESPASGPHALLAGAIDFIGGSLGGVGSVYVGQPLDTIKVKMQTFPTLYRNMFHCSRTIWRQEGIVRGFYAGTVPALVANIAENSVLFAGYGGCQKFLALVTATEKVQDLGLLANATAGSMAAFFAALVLCPTELVKCRLQAMRELRTQSNVKTEAKVGPFSLTRQILKQDGVPGLFRGLSSTIAREMPGYFCFFGGYEGTRILLSGEGEEKESVGPLGTMASGAVGGVLFWTVVFPADVVKSRIQVTGSKVSFLKLLSDIFKQEGFLALYNGLQPTLIRTIPATAALFLIYENSKKLMHSLAGF